MVCAQHLAPTTSRPAGWVAPAPVAPRRLTVVPNRVRFQELDDVALLEHVLSGSDAAWTTFFRRFRGLILSCALKVAARAGAHLGTDDLMDVLGDVSLNMVARDFRRLRLYRTDGGCSVATWIGVIATSTAKDFLRRARRHRMDPTADTELDRLPCPGQGPEDLLDTQQRRAFVDTALAGLSTRDQRFVELYFAEALSPEAIAEEMGVSVATVYSKKAKIKTRLASIAEQRV
jgi:RNA polymerase sigma-70 factor (ECF subfamily)